MNYTYSALELEIKELYGQLQIYDMQPLNIEKAAKHFDISLIYKPIESKAFSIRNRRAIFIDERKDPLRQREDFCHEFCHILKHAGTQNNIHYLFKQMQENQANAFMYHFAVPSFILNNINLPNTIYEAVPFISNNFGVSYEFSRHRLEMFFRNLITYPNHNYWIKTKASMEYASY